MTPRILGPSSLTELEKKQKIEPGPLGYDSLLILGLFEDVKKIFRYDTESLYQRWKI